MKKRIPEVAPELLYFFLGYRRESAPHDGPHLIEGIAVSREYLIVNAADS
jgi:hypothetical protein